MAGYKANKLAAIVGVKKEVVSRWENSKTRIGKESDRLVRWVCLDGIIRREFPSVLLDTNTVIELVKRAMSLNLPDLMQKIDELAAAAPKAIRVNPEMLALYGPGVDTPVSTDQLDLAIH